MWRCAQNFLPVFSQVSSQVSVWMILTWMIPTWIIVTRIIMTWMLPCHDWDVVLKLPHVASSCLKLPHVDSRSVAPSAI